MKHRYHYRGRVAPALIAGVVWILFWGTLLGEPAWKLTASSVGGALGLLSGVVVWRRIRAGIDLRNRVIVYTADGATYSLLVAAFLLSQVPRMPFRLAFFAFRNPVTIHLVSLGVAATALVYCVVLLLSIARHERANGPLRVKEFYARSVTGAEGMIGQVGSVVTACSPEGRVAVRAELWNAVSIDGRTILEGSKVVVKDIEGLRVAVQAVEAPSGGDAKNGRAVAGRRID